MVSSLLALLVVGCAAKPPGPLAVVAPGKKDPLVDRVLVVINDNSSESQEIGSYYVQKRQVPAANILKVKTTTSETTSKNEFSDDVQAPLLAKLSAGKFDYILTTKGFPLKLTDGRSVDAYMSVISMTTEAKEALINPQIKKMISPYLGKDEAFSQKKFGFYLVTRLDGYTVADAKSLVDRSLAATAAKGPYIFDYAVNRTTEGYGQLQARYTAGMDGLKSRGFRVVTDTEKPMIVPTEPMMGYVGWGSNDWGFKPDEYHRLRFRPGSIAETFVSTGGRTFEPTSGGQSLIADLVAQGVTGIKGYVSEPFLFSMALPDVLFDRYTKGYTLAESFYMASPTIGNRDVIIGDPICRPYKK